MYVYTEPDGRIAALCDEPTDGWHEVDNGEEVLNDTEWTHWDYKYRDGHAVLEPMVESYKAKLSASDYIASKACDKLMSCEGLADLIQVLKSAREEYGEVLRNRQSWRDAINRLEVEHDTA